MAFKLGDKKFTLKSKGLLNMSPFKANGNTMAFNNVDTDPPKKNLLLKLKQMKLQ
jgi:hypothetical protein